MEAIWRHLAKRLDPAPTVGVFQSISGILTLRELIEFGPAGWPWLSSIRPWHCPLATA